MSWRTVKSTSSADVLLYRPSVFVLFHSFHQTLVVKVFGWWVIFSVVYKKLLQTCLSMQNIIKTVDSSLCCCSYLTTNYMCMASHQETTFHLDSFSQISCYLDWSSWVNRNKTFMMPSLTQKLLLTDEVWLVKKMIYLKAIGISCLLAFNLYVLLNLEYN